MDLPFKPSLYNIFNCALKQHFSPGFIFYLYPICDNSLSHVIGWASFSLVDEQINLLPPNSFIEMECPWLEFAAHLLSFTQGYLLKTMPSPRFHLSGCLTEPEAGFLLDTA